MELLALLSNSDEIISKVKGALKKYTVYPLRTPGELEDLYSNIPLSLFIIDTCSHKLSSVSPMLKRIDRETAILITSERPDRRRFEGMPDSVFDCISPDDIRTDLPLLVERALERQKYKQEVRVITRSTDNPTVSRPRGRLRMEADVAGRYDAPSGGRYIHEKVIVNFARMLSVSFDMRKLLDHFIDSVMEIARVGKMSVLLREKDVFVAKTHYGLDPYLADNIRLDKDSALAMMLARTGKILQKPVDFGDPSFVAVRGDMDILQCEVSFPMIYKGKLIGIFNIDGKITDEPFYREELEIIYILCNYLAAAVKDIDLYHKMWYQKEFTNNILSSMNSGMIAIDASERITVFNQQASEILGVDASNMIGNDLRALPSPLGDILYETMVEGVSYRRHEVMLGPAKLPLGINSYRLTDEKQNPIGAGIIFSDLSASKQLEEQQRRTEKLEAVNDLMGKIAHEVRNPLTSIQTYIQILNEKQTDDEMNSFYVNTVQESINRLNSLIDKLVSFSSKPEFSFEKEEINGFMEETHRFIAKRLPANCMISRPEIEGSFFIRADRKELVRAFYYLALSAVEDAESSVKIKLSAVPSGRGGADVTIVLSYSGGIPLARDGQGLIKPLLDVDHLGAELNIPISNKIIEGHGGRLEMKREGDTNMFITTLPIVDRRGTRISYK
jgi:nitrogen-specific signal transduction histidine kinase